MEVPERDKLVPSDNTPFTTDVRDRWVPLALEPISLGERRKVAEQREMLRAAGASQAAANYPPERKAESTGKTDTGENRQKVLGWWGLSNRDITPRCTDTVLSKPREQSSINRVPLCTELKR